jgi:hypothetical protein
MMKIDKVPAEFVDGLLGDHEDRIALERAANPVKEIEFTVPDATGDCTDAIAELEKAELTELLTGITSASNQRVAKKPNEIIKARTARPDPVLVKAYRTALLDDTRSAEEVDRLHVRAYGWSDIAWERAHGNV